MDYVPGSFFLLIHNDTERLRRYHRTADLVKKGVIEYDSDTKKIKCLFVYILLGNCVGVVEERSLGGFRSSCIIQHPMFILKQ